MGRLCRRPASEHSGDVLPELRVANVLPKLVNAGGYKLTEAVVQKYRLEEPAAGQSLTNGGRDIVFRLAMLGPQAERQSPGRGTAAVQAQFARVRDTMTPGSDLRWAVLRGKLEAFEQNGDNAKSAALLVAIVATHPSTELGYPEMIMLVNASQYDAACLVVRCSRLDNVGFAQPGSMAILGESKCDRLFFLAILDVQIDAHGSAAGEPAMGRSPCARVRTATEPGSNLWRAALRGELQPLNLPDAQDEAAVLTAEMRTAHPQLTLPDDIAVRVAMSGTETTRA